MQQSSDVWTWIQAHWGLALVAGFFLLGGVLQAAQRLGILNGYLVALLGMTAFAWRQGDWLSLWAFLLGMLTAFTEIVSKFRDEPLKSFRTKEALFYHVFNGAISAFALYVLSLYWTEPMSPLDRMKAVLVAGLGSMLVMRSRLFNLKVGTEDISFGPEQFVKVFFRFMEQAIDRVRAQARVEFVQKTMDNIDAHKVLDYSVTMLAASQVLDQVKRDALKQGIPAACAAAGDAQLKSYKLGFLLLDEMGEDFVGQLFQSPKPEWLIRAPMPREAEGLLARVGIGPRETMVSYFAYGRNMCTAQMLARLGWTPDEAKKAWEKTPPRRARLEHYRLTFGRPTAASTSRGALPTLKPVTGEAVEGVLYSLPTTALSFLLTPDEPGFQKALVKVVLGEAEDAQGKKREVVEAQTWIAEVTEDEPSAATLEMVLAGAREHALSLSYINKLEQAASAAAPVAKAA